MGTGGTAARPAIVLRDRRAIWFGTGAVGAGVVLHLPMFLGARGSEVYPTRMRARGTGLAGMCARAGGLLEEITAMELRKALEAR